MKSQKIAFINAIVLLVIGFWGYAANNYSLHTAVVPISAGILLLILSKFLKKENPGLLIFVIVLSLLLFLAFLVPFQRNMEQSDYVGMLRLTIEMLVCAFAIVVYINNLIRLKKAASSNA